MTRKQLDADLLTASEIEQLLRACSNRASTGIRNRADRLRYFSMR